MKARTKSQKKRDRRGRFKVLPADATRPHRQASRKAADRQTAEDAMRVAVMKRMAVFGLSEAEAKDMRAHSVVGRWRIMAERRSGEPSCDGLSERQYLAAVRHQQAHAAYARAMQIPDGLAVDGVRGGSGDTVSDSYVEWATKARAHYDGAIDALVEANASDRTANLVGAVRTVVIDNVEVTELMRDVRIALNVLARFYGV